MEEKYAARAPAYLIAKIDMAMRDVAGPWP